MATEIAGRLLAAAQHDLSASNWALVGGRRRLAKTDPLGSCAAGCTADADGNVKSVQGGNLGPLEQVRECHAVPNDCLLPAWHPNSDPPFALSLAGVPQWLRMPAR